MIKRAAAVAAIGMLATFGGAVAAADYPPNATTPTTVVSTDTVADPGTGDRLPATGSGADQTMKIAGGVALTGVGLLAVARFRRRPTTA